MFTLNKRKATTKRSMMRRRPTLEALEGRVILSTLQVNTLSDSAAVNPHKSPVDNHNDISLRSAIQFADDHPTTSFAISLPPGTITLDQGELDILVDNKLTIEGSTKGGQTIISGNNQSRVFLTLSGNVAMSNLVIEHGSVVGQGIAQGGGLLNDGATDTLTSVQFIDNTVVGGNGAKGAAGKSGENVGTAGGAGGAGTNAEGGAIANVGSDSSLTLTNCMINSNDAIGGDGGPGGAGGSGDGATFDLVGFGAGGGAGGAGGAAGAGLGGGVFNGGQSRLILSGDTFLKNEAFGGSAGIGGAGGNGYGGAGGNDANGDGGAGPGGSALGGAGGAGGLGGLGAGGGIYIGGGQITLVSSTTTFTSNEAVGGTGGYGGYGGNAIGGSGGSGFLNDPGVSGGSARSGVGGNGGQGGNGEGGAIFNGAGGSISSTTAVLVSSNSARGAPGGNGGNAGAAFSGKGGDGGTNTLGGPSGSGAASFDAVGGNAGNGADGGVGEGGGLFNASGATVTFKAGGNTSSPPVSTFSMNQADGGSGGNGGTGGSATAGNGGNGGTGGVPAGTSGGNAGSATSGSGGSGGLGDVGVGGGLLDAGTASFTGVTVDFTKNQAAGGPAGSGGNGGIDAYGGYGGAGHGGPGGNGGNATGGNGGNAGAISGTGEGGGIAVDPSGTLVLKPRLGAKKGSKQAGATDVITGNSATPGAPGTAGSPGANIAPGTGTGGSPPGKNGVFTVGQPGHVLAVKHSIGGGIAIFGIARGASHTLVTGNSATVGANIDGTFSP